MKFKPINDIRQNGGEAVAQVTDLMVSEQIDALVEETVKTYNRIDILINNAARSFMVPLMDLREDGWDKIFGTNCKAVFLLSRVAARKSGKESKLGSRCELRRYGRPEEIGHVILFLASDEASYVTGKRCRWMAAIRHP